MSVGKHLAREGGREGEALERFALRTEDEHQTGEINGGEEGNHDTDDEGGCEALDGACTEHEEDDTGDYRSKVGVEDS